MKKIVFGSYVCGAIIFATVYAATSGYGLGAVDIKSAPAAPQPQRGLHIGLGYDVRDFSGSR